MSCKITYALILAETDAEIKLLTIYDKSERENITDKDLLDLMQKNGLELLQFSPRIKRRSWGIFVSVFFFAIRISVSL